MCDICLVMNKLIQENKQDLELIQRMIDEKKLELYAGNCYPNEILYWLDKGNHYTISSILMCKECDTYYFVGFCLYGSPKIKIMDKQDALKWGSNIEWGYVGTLFNKIY